MTEKQRRRAEKAKRIRGLYCITAERLSKGRGNLEVVRAMLSGGAKIIQYREKNMPMLRQYRQCLEIRKMTADAGALFLIDDHADLAVAVGADGVHVGQDDLPVAKVREVAGEEMLVGLSTHNPEQAREAAALGADYIDVGPLFETHTKEDVCAPVGTAYLDDVVKNIALPFVAIGGIKTSNLETVLAHGAKCVALVSGVVGAEDISRTVEELRKKIDRRTEEGLL